MQNECVWSADCYLQRLWHGLCKIVRLTAAAALFMQSMHPFLLLSQVVEGGLKALWSTPILPTDSSLE